MLQESHAQIEHLRRRDLKATIKDGNPGDIITIADTAVEDHLTDLITQYDPGIPVVREEFTPSHSPKVLDRVWCIDPIDGTVNFAREFPAMSAVSIGYWEMGQPMLGGILRLDTDTHYLADGTASLMRQDVAVKPLSTRTHPQVQRVIAIDVPRREPSHIMERGMSLYQAIRFDVGDIRMLGSAALALVAVAAGHLDAYVNFTMGPWDVAAGQALVEQAGGVVLNDRGKRREFWDQSVIAAADQATADHIVDIIRVL